MTIQGLFESQVRLNPDRIALTDKINELTYQQLNIKSNIVAGILRGHDIFPEDKVLICIERDASLIIGLLGTLKSGAAYIVIDPKYPNHRIESIIVDVQARIVITSKKFAALFTGKPLQIILIENLLALPDSPENPVNVNSDSNLAYIIYTSGSTGVPKGVMVEHRNCCNFLLWSKAFYEVRDDDVFASFAPAFFDLSIFEMFTPLISGARLMVAERPFDIYDDRFLSEITVLSTVPSALKSLTAFRQLLDGNYKLPKLKHFNFAGEVLEMALVNKVKTILSPKNIYNCYGPTETTTYATVLKLEGEAHTKPTIGCPVALAKIYILDEYLIPVPDGIEGEIFIGGPPVTRGYHNQSGLTREKFLPELDNNFDKMYRTGDIGIKLHSGEIKYLGRMDGQVKIKGYRIELGEIESALLQCDVISDAAVLTYSINEDEQSLAAFLIGEKVIDTDDLKSELRKVLPIYMIPTYFKFLENFPITPTGKLDSVALLKEINQ